MARRAKELPTFVAEVEIGGGNNKNLLSLFNPAASGKVLRVLRTWVICPSVTGNQVILTVELRHSTEVTTGTTVTPAPLDSIDEGNASGVVRQEPTGITDHATLPLWWSWITQINTGIGNQGDERGAHPDDAAGKPITLREGHGLYMKQRLNNNSDLRIGVMWTEDTA